jgi:hypothetical protein
MIHAENDCADIVPNSTENGRSQKYSSSSNGKYRSALRRSGSTGAVADADFVAPTAVAGPDSALGTSSALSLVPEAVSSGCVAAWWWAEEVALCGSVACYLACPEYRPRVQTNKTPHRTTRRTPTQPKSTNIRQCHHEQTGHPHHTSSCTAIWCYNKESLRSHQMLHQVEQYGIGWCTSRTIDKKKQCPG